MVVAPLLVGIAGVLVLYWRRRRRFAAARTGSAAP
jgi:hypothetical protein